MELIDLDECVVKALQLFVEEELPDTDFGDFKKPLVLGSGNAAVTGRIIFQDKDAVFADEGTYKGKLENIQDIDGAVLISASGGKHAPGIAKTIKEKGKTVILLTCNKDALANEHADKTFVSPKQPEPYTYNTSTYMGMIMGHTKEDPEKILSFIRENIYPLIPENLDSYNAFYILVPAEFDNVRELFMTKFDELFGPMVNGRVFTPEQTKHAKTVIPSDKELFISLGYENNTFGTERLNVPLPESAGPATVMAIGYYLIGKIQKQKPAYFKENIVKYTKMASEEFSQEIKPIVE